MRLWEELEMEPVKEFEQQVASGDIRVFVLSQQNLTHLNKFYAEVHVQSVHVACVQVNTRGSAYSNLNSAPIHSKLTLAYVGTCTMYDLLSTPVHSWRRRPLTWSQGHCSCVRPFTLSGRGWRCHKRSVMPSHNSTLDTNLKSLQQ